MEVKALLHEAPASFASVRRTMMKMKQLLAEFVSAIDAEIALLEKESRDQSYELMSGRRDEKSTGSLYVFVLADTLRLPEDASGTLKIEGHDVAAMVVSVEGNRIWLLVESSEQLPDYLPSARLIIDETQLLRRLKEELQALNVTSNFGLAAEVFDLEPTVVGRRELRTTASDRLDSHGREILEQCMGSNVTFVWGPPGTGKTFTIAALVACIAELGETVLVTSHTHAAVEQALWALVEPPSPREDRSGGFLHGSPLVEGGRILKVGSLREREKFPPRVELDAYLAELAKERNANLATLDEELQRVLRGLADTQPSLALWIRLQDLQQEYAALQIKHEESLSAYEAARAERDRSKAEVAACERAHAEAQRSFVLGRRGRVARTLAILAAARLALTSVEATTGEAEARALRTYRSASETYEHLLEARTATEDIPRYDTLRNELTTWEARASELRAEIDAIGASSSDDARHIVQDATAIFATLTKLYVDRDLLRNMAWDTVIVDEASMAMPPLLAYAASRAKRRVIVVGDMYQLPPVVKSKPESPGGILGRDIFEWRGITDALDDGRPVRELTKLITQRRMHADIASATKALIPGYTDLQDHPDVLKRSRPPWVTSLGFESALVVVDIADLHPWSGKVRGSLSRFNFTSAQAAVELAALYAAQLQRPAEKAAPPIGIVTPYAAQRRYLNKLIVSCGLEPWVTAGTVHTFQGSECDVIIFDSVVGEPHYTSRFTNPRSYRETRRDINVAVTRARHQFVFVGDVRWLEKKAHPESSFGKLWSHLKQSDARFSARELLGEGFKDRVSKGASSSNAWSLEDAGKAVLLTEVDFYEHFEADLRSARDRVILYTPFIGKTRWPQVERHIAALRDREVEVYLLHKPLSDPEWRSGNKEFGQAVLSSLRDIGVKLIPLSGVHAKTIVIDGEIVYEGSLNWASQTSSYEHMWRIPSSDMARLIEKMLQLQPISEAYGREDDGAVCPHCDGPLIVVNQMQQAQFGRQRDPHPVKLACLRHSQDKNSCPGYIRRVDGRAPFREPPLCGKGSVMQLLYAASGRPGRWQCEHKGCRSIRWSSGDCESPTKKTTTKPGARTKPVLTTAAALHVPRPGGKPLPKEAATSGGDTDGQPTPNSPTDKEEPSVEQLGRALAAVILRARRRLP